MYYKGKITRTFRSNKWISISFFWVLICMNLFRPVFSQQIKDFYDFSVAKILIPKDLSESEQAAIQMLVEEQIMHIQKIILIWLLK